MEHFTIRHARYAPGTRMAAHRHDAPSLCIVLAGSYQETIRARTGEQTPGALLFCPSEEPHSQVFGRAGASKLIITPDPVALAYLDGLVRLDEAPRICSAEVGRLGRRMVAEMANADSFSRVALEGLSCELLALFGRGASRAGDTPSRWLKDACDYIAAHPAGAVSVREIAAAIACHPVRLSRAFRRVHGVTVGQYQRRLRIAQASDLLRATRMPLAEIAQACGFCDQSHLSRVFKAELGCTPAAFRRCA
jgi:AraC family transcriptional regulator